MKNIKYIIIAIVVLSISSHASASELKNEKFISQFYGKSETLDRCYTLAAATYYRAARYVILEEELKNKGPCYSEITNAAISYKDSYLFGYNYGILWAIKEKEQCHSSNQFFTQGCLDYISNKKLVFPSKPFKK